MRCRVAEFGCKEVINTCDGYRMGYVYDVAADVSSGRIIAIIVPGPCRFFGLFGREDDYVIPWECIKKIGDEIILVEICGHYQREKRTKCRKPTFF